MIDDDHLNGQYLLGISGKMDYLVVMRINDEGGASDGLVDRYAVITSTVDWGPGPPQGPGAPENFVFKQTSSGFGAAYAYVDKNGTQRAFVSANNARPENTKYSWGLFEIELPIVVPDACWNIGRARRLSTRQFEVRVRRRVHLRARGRYAARVRELQ